MHAQRAARCASQLAHPLLDDRCEGSRIACAVFSWIARPAVGQKVDVLPGEDACQHSPQQQAAEVKARRRLSWCEGRRLESLTVCDTAVLSSGSAIVMSSSSISSAG
eukprot:2256683-Prymnesium_polylepis.1